MTQANPRAMAVGMRDRALLHRHLKEALDHVARGEAHMRRQREVISEFERDGRETALAKRLLAEFEAMQKMHIADRDRIIKELGGE